MNRRTYLRSTVGSVACLAVVPTAGTVAATQDDENSQADDDADDTRNELVQGEADVDLSVHEQEDDEHVSYVEGSDEVEFAAVMSGDEVVMYERTDWETWARRRCISAAATTAREFLDEELDQPVGSGITSRVDGVDRAAFVSVADVDEELTLDAVASVTPATVAASYELEGRVFDTNVPIYVGLRTGTVTMDGTAEAPGDEDAVDTIDDHDDDERDGDGDGSDSDSGEGGDDDSTPENGGDDTGTDDGDRQEDDDSDGFGPGFGPLVALAGSSVGYYLFRGRGGMNTETATEE